MGEDSGFLREVAAEPRAKADDTMNLPGAGSILAVQRATRVSLSHVRENVMSVQIPHLTVTSCP